MHGTSHRSLIRPDRRDTPYRASRSHPPAGKYGGRGGAGAEGRGEREPRVSAKHTALNGPLADDVNAFAEHPDEGRGGPVYADRQ
ncbi:hypothetical protein GCM10014715_64390 [Streptomyces spiralis]|uniref:Uncharacterized protein n=1 Tax=Streptomyces spiralis TaxID=66376 RepID=A0A919AF43_9ACTN|nr:hypothetical protein GCM10014715_64390 [Streptomyces spiralis]